MARFPGYRMPFQYYSPYRRNNFYYNPHIPVSESIDQAPTINRAPTNINLGIQDTKSRNFGNNTSMNNANENRNSNNTIENRNSKHSKPNNDVWLDLFGIKLYFDDVLILSLLFFLYKEDVKDEGLFLALVMLLIS